MSALSQSRLFPASLFNCHAPCKDVNGKSTTVVESWEGSKSKQSFSHSVTRNVSVTYTWAFQKTNHASDVSSRAEFEFIRLYHKISEIGQPADASVTVLCTCVDAPLY